MVAVPQTSSILTTHSHHHTSNTTAHVKEK
uniref:Uncharacterized protein n=1 Tax=Anguilla anguilla TaxID=7936 RepID=A0A0E9PD52_ANGAN